MGSGRQMAQSTAHYAAADLQSGAMQVVLWAVARELGTSRRVCPCGAVLQAVGGSRAHPKLDALDHQREGRLASLCDIPCPRGPGCTSCTFASHGEGLIPAWACTAALIDNV